MSKLMCAILIVFSGAAFASKITLDVQAKDLSVNTTVPFKAGVPIKISGADKAGKDFALEITSAADDQGVVRIAYKLERGGDSASGSVLMSPTETVKEPSLTTTDVQFEAKVTE